MPGFWLKNLETVRKVQWSGSWLWDIQFSEGPSGFGEGPSSWFPAVTVRENIYALETHSFNGGMINNLELPKNTTPFSLSMTVVDDVWLSVEAWLEHWVNSTILNGNDAVSFIEDAVKQVNIAKITSYGSLVQLNSYYVYPKGNMDYEGTSDSSVITHEIEFVVAGTISRTHYRDATGHAERIQNRTPTVSTPETFGR